MIHTLKISLLKQQPQLHFIPSPPLINSNKLPTTTTLRRFIQATPKSTQQQQSMDQSQTTQDQHNKEEHEELVDQQKSATATATEDVMSHSFGQGYKTRSDEEGFGGIYGCNNNQSEEEEDVNILHPEYDKSQGSEVKEKEKARNQMEASS